LEMDPFQKMTGEHGLESRAILFYTMV
jgi:hypothetical protein